MKESLNHMLNERSHTHIRPCTALSCVYEVSENAKLYKQRTDQRLLRTRDADRGLYWKGAGGNFCDEKGFGCGCYLTIPNLWECFLIVVVVTWLCIFVKCIGKR